MVVTEVPWDEPDAVALRAAQRVEIARRYGRPDAVAFYTREGYRPLAQFGHYVGSTISLCFERAL